jgi:hypothetical protein
MKRIIIGGVLVVFATFILLSSIGELTTGTMVGFGVFWYGLSAWIIWSGYQGIKKAKFRKNFKVKE